MSGIRALRKIQFGREDPAGTAVDATTVYRGIGLLNDKREIIHPEENVGMLVPTTRAYSPKHAAEIELDDTEATFEQILHLLEMGIMTATADRDDVGVYADTGSGYIYTYDFPTTAQKTPKYYTVRGGDNQRVDVAEYCFAEKIVLAGKGGEAVMMGGTLIGRQAADGDFTADISTPTVEEIIFSKGELSINATSSAFGTTEVPNALLEFNLEIETGFKARFAAIGDKYFSHVNQVQPKVKLELTLEHGSAAETEIAAARNQTARAVQLLFEGSALTTPGDYSYKTLQIDLCGTYAEVPAIDDDDDSDVVKLSLIGGYDATRAKMGTITVVNELSAVQ